MRQPLSLKARAVALLSRREHSRLELTRKLSAHAEDADVLSRLLDDLTREGWLSDERYAQSLVHRRASTHGSARIASELRLGGVSDTAISDIRQTLRESEYDRARVVWQKKFGVAPVDRLAFGKQARFLAGRGFNNDVIYRVIGDAEAFDDAADVSSDDSFER